MKTILVPTDFSKNAENALNYAVQIAKKEKAQIILFHAYNVTFISPDMPMEFYSEQMKATKAEVCNILAGISKRVVAKSKVPCECLSSEGLAVDAIHSIANKKKVQLIVMGTKGASGVKEVLTGSVTAKVATNSRCPVVIVPEKATYDKIRQITFATDYRQGDYTSLKKLTDFARTFKSKIQVVHVVDPEYFDEVGFMEKFKAKVQAKIEYRAISFKLLKGGDPEKKLENHLKASSADLLAITQSDKTWMERFFFKSVSRKLIYHTRIPMIVFHNK